MESGTSLIYDGIIVGAGHNSLVLQAYLGRAGLRVLCIERRSVAGGALVTIEDAGNPGFLHNTHSFYHRALNRMPWYHDLDLERHGAVYLEPVLNVALLSEAGEALEWWTDFEKTVDSFARFSNTDAATLGRWRDAFLPIVERILIPEAQAPPLEPTRRRALLERSPEGRLLLKISRLSPLEFVRREFRHPVIQAGLLFFNGLREVDLRCPGFGHHIAALLASSGKAQMCRGGSVALARALVATVEESGGELRLQTEPKRFILEGDRVVGVETASGERFMSRHFVVSGLNPHQTFLDLLDKDALPRNWRDRASAFRYNLVAPLFALNLNLREPPRYTAAGTQPGLQEAFMVILGLDHVDRYLEMVTCHQEGRKPPNIMWGSCPTLFDPSQAPQGKHTAFMWEKTPYRLNGDPTLWDSERDRLGQEMLDVWARYAPNLTENLISWFTRSPLDVERTFPNMREGDLLVGAFTNGQIGYNRPFPGAGHYRTHLQGLYLCGSCCHPGGNITGLPGYNCAQVILRDLGIDANWAPEPIETQLERLSAR
jgi:phytoene dehydrogenase-like protein